MNRNPLARRGLLLALLLSSAALAARAQNVGVGTLTPGEKLDVVGGNLRLSTAGSRLIFPDGTFQTTAAASGSFIQNQTAAAQTGGFNLSGTGVLGGSLRAASARINNLTTAGFVLSDASGNLSSTSTTGNSFVNNTLTAQTGANFNVGGAGTVGGVLTAGTELVVNGANDNAGTLTNSLRFGLANSGEAIGVQRTTGSTQYGMNFYTASVNRMTVGFNGNVGIGISTPNQKLEVVGGVRASGNAAFTAVSAADQGAHLQWNRSGGQGETWLINHMGGGTADAGIRFAGITTSTGITPTEWARFLNNGNFGIGTTAPSAKLDVDGSTRLRGLTTAGVVTTDASGNLSSATATSLDPTTASNGLTKVGNDFRLGGTLAAATTIAQGGNAFSLTGTGNVGIGTTAPLQKLEVVGGIRASGNAAFTAVSGTNEGAHLQWNRSGGQGETWLINHLGGGTADAGIRFAGVTTSTGTTPTEWARFLNNGNFGIGTTAPTQKLDVRGNLRLGEDGGAVTGTGNVVEFIGPGINTDPIGLYRINTASDASELRVVVGDNLDVNDKFSVGRTTTSTEGTLATGTFTSVFTVRADGNVGIGTISPATRLDVNGNLRLAVRLCPVNTGGTYTLVAADVAFSIFKTQIGNAVSTITLPGSIGQVEGQELTIINASDTNVIVNGSTDNGGGATLPNANGPGLHAVKYVWATYSGGTGVWFRVQ